MTSVQVSIPAHRDEPALLHTLEAVAAEVDGARSAADFTIRVLINGPDPTDGPAKRATVDFTRRRRDLDVVIETTEIPSKPWAWTLLRDTDADIVVFLDADVVVEAGSLDALIATIEAGAAVAAARQVPWPARTATERVASVPHRVAWNTLAGTLYAARTDALPESMPAVLLDDAWLHATVGVDAVVTCPGAVARFRAPATVGDLWRQRRRAEAGKRQLSEMGLELVASPTAGSGAWRRLEGRDLAAAAVLAVIKVAARTLPARDGRWGWSASTKG